MSDSHIYMYMALIGLLLCIIAHLSSLIGVAEPLGIDRDILTFVMSWVIAPANSAASKLEQGGSLAETFRAIFRYCPNWMNALFVFFFLYSMLGISIAAILESMNHLEVSASQTLSGCLLTFYWFSFSALYAFNNSGMDPEELEDD